MKKKLTKKSLKRFEQLLAAEEKSSATIEKYLRDVRKFYRFLPDNKRIDKEQVCRFKAELIDEYQLTSVNSMLAALNKYFVLMEWPELVVKRVRVQRQIFRNEERELSMEDYRRLLNEAKRGGSERLYLIMLTLCSAGIRVGELSFFTKEAVVRGRAEVACKNKNRMVLIPRQLKQLLLAYAKKNQINSGCIFVTRGGKPVDRRNIWSGMKRLGKRTGVRTEKIFPHNLRHLFAKTYYQRERDIVRLADILGHSSIETARIYTSTTIGAQRHQVEKLGLFIT